MTWELAVENVAGIESGDVTFAPGLNAVWGSNWQGKSSLLAAVMTAMGTRRSITEGADRGRVVLETEDRCVDVELRREDGEVELEGEPYITGAPTREAASLFAFLGEDNDVRRAVRRGENLESVLTRPLDFENIDERIGELAAERDRLDAELSRAEDAASELPAVKRRIEDLEAEIADLEATRKEMSAIEEDADFPERHEDLSTALAERNEVESRIQRLERSVERIQEKLSEHRTDLEELTVPQDEELEERLAEAREDHERAKADAELLQSIYAPTKRLLDEDRLDLITDVERGVVDDSLRCWTCGADATREDLEEFLEALGDRVTELRSVADEHRERVERIEERLEDHREAERREADLRATVADLESTLEERRRSLEAARDRREELNDRVDELSERVDATGDRLTDLESDLKYKRAKLEDRREEHAELEMQAEKRDLLRSEREEVTEEIVELRTRKETVKRRTRESFEEAIAELLNRFDTGFETARLTADFELVVARDGRETSLDALSEGERELLGVVAALAGHEAFEVAEDVPVMLIDDLGGLAEENVRTLVSYLQERVDYLVFTAHSEYTDLDGRLIEPTEWTLVSSMTTG